MSDNKNNPKRLLRALERWRESELEAAQVHYVERTQTAAECESQRDRVQSDIAESQSVAREQLSSGQSLSPDSLRRFAEFGLLQGEELKQAQAALEESRIQRDAAQAKVVRHFEELSVVQRLSERRAAEATLAATRTDQKRLDEQALSRPPPVGGNGTSAPNEE
jgi:flagellar biosynthesis chaperone FliJ